MTSIGKICSYALDLMQLYEKVVFVTIEINDSINSCPHHTLDVSDVSMITLTNLILYSFQRTYIS